MTEATGTLQLGKILSFHKQKEARARGGWLGLGPFGMEEDSDNWRWGVQLNVASANHLCGKDLTFWTSPARGRGSPAPRP